MDVRKFIINKDVDKGRKHPDDNNIDSLIAMPDRITKHSATTDQPCLQKERSISSQCHDQQESSDNEDDEVNELFKQIRRMSDRSVSHSSTHTSRKSNNEKPKCANPFLEPFQRHSSVDMKGKKSFNEFE